MSTVAIDKAGRIVIPKDLRDELGLVPGTEIELEADRLRHSITLRLRSHATGLRTEEGIPVHHGAGPGWSRDEYNRFIKANRGSKRF